MASNAKDLYKDLEKYAKEESKNTKKRFVAYEGKKKSRVPWGLFFILSSLVSLYFFFTTDFEKTKKYAIGFAAVAKRTVEDYKQTGKLKITTEAINITPHVQEKIEDSVKNAATEVIPKGKEYVQIDGKYYEKREDNIYNINGKRVFYKSDKSITISPEQKNEGLVQETKETLQNRSDFLNEVTESP